ncbi:MAG: TolC family protein [Treponema sp.]|jgi:multidrug efflux system outer membrane protein|nr:TolC family protein [Treponema sp.]
MIRRCCCVLLFLSTYLSAQEPAEEILTLERAVERAVDANVGIKKNVIELGLAKTDADSLWAQIFPSINLSAGMSYGIPLHDAAPRNGPAYSASAGLTLNFNAGLPYAMKNITLAYRQKLLTVEDARRLLSLNVAKDFYSLVAREQNLLVFENAKKLAEGQMERDTAAWRSGYKGELEYLQGRLSAERAALDYQKALAEYRNALAEFCAALGLDGAAVRLSGAIEIRRIFPDSEKLIGEYLSRRPDLAAKQNAVERSAAEEKQKTLSAKAPSLSLSANWGAQAADDFSWEGDKSLSASVRLSIPVNPWIPNTTENRGLKAAAASVEMAKIDFEDALEKARREIRLFCANLETVWNEAELSRLQLEIAGRSYELSEEAYRIGAMSFVDFEIIRNKYTEAQQGLLAGELAYKLLVLDLAFALNISESELAGLSAGRGD